MNDVIRAMVERRSVRAYTDKMPERKKIEAVIEAGLWAASGMNRQGPIVVAVTNRELRDRLSAMNADIMGRPGTDPFYGAPVVLIVLAPRDQPNRVYDGSLVMGNLMLAAHALGLGSCWIHRAREEFDTAEGSRGRLRGHRPLHPGLSRGDPRGQAEKRRSRVLRGVGSGRPGVLLA